MKRNVKEILSLLLIVVIFSSSISAVAVSHNSNDDTLYEEYSFPVINLDEYGLDINTLTEEQISYILYTEKAPTWVFGNNTQVSGSGESSKVTFASTDQYGTLTGYMFRQSPDSKVCQIYLLGQGYNGFSFSTLRFKSLKVQNTAWPIPYQYGQIGNGSTYSNFYASSFTNYHFFYIANVDVPVSETQVCYKGSDVQIYSNAAMWLSAIFESGGNVDIK